MWMWEWKEGGPGDDSRGSYASRYMGLATLFHTEVVSKAEALTISQAQSRCMHVPRLANVH